MLCPGVQNCRPGPTSVRAKEVLRVTGMAGTACDHREVGAELQTSEVQIVLLAVPHRERDKLPLDDGAALRPRCAAGKAGLCLLEALVGA